MQTEIDITLPRPHDTQLAIKHTANRFNVVCLGRRSGKTTLGIDIASNACINGQNVGWFAPTYKYLLEVWREIDNILKPLIDRRSVQERRIELVTGGIIEFWSLDKPKAGESRSYHVAIFDEAAMVPDLLDTWQMSVRPTLADYGGTAWFLSTPKGHNGFWQLYNLGLDDNKSEWSCWQMPTSVNPHIPQSEIEAMRASLPSNVYAQEIDALFLDSGGGVFRYVNEAVNHAVSLAHSKKIGRCIFGVDWGRNNDFTVITVIDVEARVVAHIDRFNMIDYQTQAQRLKALYERFKPFSIIAESNAMGQAVIDMLAGSGLPIQPFNTTNASKKQAVDALALAFENGTITIPDYKPLISELLSFEGVKLPSGMIRYEATKGGHDDTVMSLLIGWSGIDDGHSLILF